ncbi:MAG TPA: response regulator [Geminicoccus sp.]|jgi:DNA-binding NarL/FixJ family response regulator|uniref:response regulator n=1 Tax=Geminicoccus sp. TaxID=2024832 RepID=UPI002E3625C6|nr:response regulator [Geminicoccus sp.]HEX2527618.1 response regulator [Geminicoccus sp.]
MLRILVVEDDLLIATVLVSLLEDLGHEVCGQAVDAAGAVEEAAKSKPDMVLMDVRLAGGSSGEEAAAEVRRCFGIRSLFVSGNLIRDFVARTGALDPIGYLNKPVDRATLERTLRSLDHGRAS